MFKIQSTVKRQIELLGLCLQNREKWKASDYAVHFDLEELAIKRDMQELRAQGIRIHSAKGPGICLASPMGAELAKEMICQYLSLVGSAPGLDKATRVLVKKHGELALHTVVVLQRCIESGTAALIDYEKTAGKTEKNREILPHRIFRADGQWRVLCTNEGTMKQFLLTKIRGVTVTDRKFKKVPSEQLDDLFRFSFRTWIGPEVFRIRIRLSKEWADRLKPQQMLETQVLTEHEDGSVDFEATVNSLNEVASWVVSRGKGVKVLEPDELKARVLELAKEAMANYA